MSNVAPTSASSLPTYLDAKVREWAQLAGCKEDSRLHHSVTDAGQNPYTYTEVIFHYSNDYEWVDITFYHYHRSEGIFGSSGIFGNTFVGSKVEVFVDYDPECTRRVYLENPSNELLVAIINEFQNGGLE